MRAVIQRVSRASVTVHGAIRSSIARGLLVLVAIEETDNSGDTDWLSGKIARLRVFPDEAGIMNRSVQEVGGGILVVSQFTLFASTSKGNRPSYARAAPPGTAIPLYEEFLRALERELGHPVASGEFGADMQVESINDGPVTILIDTRDRE